MWVCLCVFNIRICAVVLRSSPIYYFPTRRSPHFAAVSIYTVVRAPSVYGVFGSFPDSGRRVRPRTQNYNEKACTEETGVCFIAFCPVHKYIYIYIHKYVHAIIIMHNCFLPQPIVRSHTHICFVHSRRNT